MVEEERCTVQSKGDKKRYVRIKYIYWDTQTEELVFEGQEVKGLVEVRFKPADVGSVADGSVTEVKLADGAVTNVKVNASAAIAKTKLASLAIVDADISSVDVGSITGAVSGKAADTTGDKGVLAMGWDTATDEVVIDREAQKND